MLRKRTQKFMVYSTSSFIYVHLYFVRFECIASDDFKKEEKEAE